MSSPRFFLFFYFIAIIFIIPTVLCTDQLFYFCSNSKNFTSGDRYDSNLKWLTSYLSSRTPLTGFSLGSFDHPTQYQSHGLALCRGDVSRDDCKSCVNKAKLDIRSLCPTNKAAIVWYDHCLLKYSDEKFFGQVDNENRFSMLNVNNVSNPNMFNQKVRDLLTQLSEKASRLSNMYAAGETAVGGSYDMLYGMAQCTRDLARDDCNKCLYDAIAALPSCCDGKQGGRVFGGSCSIRYEIYRFVNP